MKKWEIKLWVNISEYIITIVVTAKNVVKLTEYSVRVDGIFIEFEEEIYSLKEIP